MAAKKKYDDILKAKEARELKEENDRKQKQLQEE